MSHAPRTQAQLTLTDLRATAAEGRKLVMVTAYDAPTAGIADAAGVDMILVGDSVGNVCLGFDSTLPVTMAMMRHHLEAVARAHPRAFLMADLPYLSYHLSPADALRNAGSLVRAGAQALKLEGGRKRLDAIKALLDADIPVMGHLGLTPQSLHAMGGYRVQAKEAAQALRLLEEAHALQEVGCFALLLEGIPAELGRRATESLAIPTIGIGAGPHCSGQVLVFHDVLGLIPGSGPKFVRTYLDGFGLLSEALGRWVGDVREGAFPGKAESYMLPDAARAALDAWTPPGSSPEAE